MTASKVSAMAVAALSAGLAAGGWETPPEGFVLTERHRSNPPVAMAERLSQIRPAAQGEFRLTPTYVSCSVCWGVRKLERDPVLEYREKGAEGWQTAETPPYFDDAENYRGSILGLREDCEYEVRASADGKPLAQGAFRTWASDVKIAKTVVVDPKTAKYPIVVSDQGSPDGWILYTAKKGDVLGGDAITNSSVIRVTGAKYVVLDGLTVRGGGGRDQSAVFIEKSRGVRVRNCEICGFGNVGRQVFTDKAHGYPYPDAKGPADSNPGRFLNWQAGVMIYPGAAEVTVERCYIHDARGRSNAWYYAHPAGTEGIFVYRPDGSVVIRWNDIVGSDFHRWNDAIEGCDNFRADGGFNRDSDIYGNFCIYANDDCVELDGGQQNVRCFGNRFEAGFTDVSIQGCMVSPVYLFDNLFAPCCDEFGQANPCIKTFGFDPYWYAPYAYVRGNCFGERSYRPSLGQTSRWDWREGNFFCTNDVPVRWARLYPVRNLPFMLDRGIIRDVKIADGKAPQPVKFLARATARQPFRIRKNFDADWFRVTPSEGVLPEGETEFTVTFYPSKMKDRRQWRSAFVVRTPEGLSRCMSVYAENVDFEQSERPFEGPKTVYAKLEKPISYSGRQENAKADEIAFDVAEEGDYWFFVRGKASGRARVLAAVDDGEPRRALLILWNDHAAWNMVRPGASEYVHCNGFDPFHLTPGRHVLKLFPCTAKTAPVTILGAAVSDRPEAFEPR